MNFSFCGAVGELAVCTAPLAHICHNCSDSKFDTFKLRLLRKCNITYYLLRRVFLTNAIQQQGPPARPFQRLGGYHVKIFDYCYYHCYIYYYYYYCYYYYHVVVVVVVVAVTTNRERQ